MVSAVGVLALQGAVDAHARALEACGAAPRPVRCPEDLEGLGHLVLPGGESTTLQRLLARFGLWEEIPARVRRGELVLFGTCAGAILLGRDEGAAPPRWGLLDVAVERNAYGRQLRSRVADVELPAFGRTLACPFIRAPRFSSPGDDVVVLASLPDEGPVLVETPACLAATFHPELAGDPVLHEHFLRKRAGTVATPVPPRQHASAAFRRPGLSLGPRKASAFVHPQNAGRGGSVAGRAGFLSE